MFIAAARHGVPSARRFITGQTAGQKEAMILMKTIVQFGILAAVLIKPATWFLVIMTNSDTKNKTHC